MADTELAEELLQIEEADAWFEYLEATRGQTAARYDEVELWAGRRDRLHDRLVYTRTGDGDLGAADAWRVTRRQP